MADKYPKLKLKRRKLNVEEPRNDAFFKNTIIKKNDNSTASIEGSSVSRPLLPTQTWWSREDLSPVENLWALALGSTLLCPEAPVAELPTASRLSSPVDQPCEWRWCNVREIVSPLPCSSNPAWSPFPLTPQPSNKDPPLYASTAGEQTILPILGQTRQTTSASEGPLSGFGPCPREPGEGMSGSGSDRPRPPPLGARVPASYGSGGQGVRQKARECRVESCASSQTDPKQAGARQNTGPASPDFTSSQSEGEKSHSSFHHPTIFGASSRGLTLGEGEEEGEVMKRRRLPALQEKASSCDRRHAAPVEERGRGEERAPGRGRADWDAGGRGGGEKQAGGEERLQSCPMCLVAFPAGFTQMDCDTHLAKCLSEMTVDITCCASGTQSRNGETTIETRPFISLVFRVLLAVAVALLLL
ncbi:hypothetical protein DPEC_G00015110 [Dallia pectoralis]|uniref:Uncharacterized protein n=1 Tax=Dallia pectoralis TaxID=75939 RepID=A0ACC2HNX1_DALPE|nr:hypothetical protein DPEC_G00015110 [Dallia pectoralis]